MKIICVISVTILIISFTAFVGSGGPELPTDVAAEFNRIDRRLDYNRDVKPILSDKCFACHGPDKAKQQAGLRLDVSASAYGPLPESPGKVAIQPGRIWKSEMVRRIISGDPDYMMPTPASHLSLTAKEKAFLAKWIEQGAVYQPHWAFVKPVKNEPPPVAGDASVMHPVDRFIRSRLNEMKLRPAAPAPRDLLLRRLSLDITGLPPTIAETDAFLQDKSPDAYEKQVDRLLASVHYGERMAADWLDLARFADTHGYSVDRLRDMSPYRDWVIRAFNDNLPYDRFIHWQLAGDMMPGRTRDMVVATAFNRLHQQNMEGGIVEEEFQREYVLDRTNTFGEAFMAMSVGCARCHDHKYDPVSQKNYYELSAFFNNVREAGQISWNNDLPTPTLMLPDAVQERVIDSLRKAAADGQQRLEAEVRLAAARGQAWIAGNGHRALSSETLPGKGLQALYRLDGHLGDELDTSRKGVMKHDEGVTGDLPVFANDRGGKVLLLDGDVYLDLRHAGVFCASEPFTIGMWLNIPGSMKEGVIFHKSDGERLYNFKGFNLSLRNDRFEITMAHTAPSNAIIRVAGQPVPRDRWIHVALAYDGSATAAGFRLYQDGRELVMDTEIDKLYKDIIFYRKAEPALQIGGWWRGTGFTGGKADDIAVYARRLTDLEIGILAGRQKWSDIASADGAALSADAKKLLSEYHALTADTLVSFRQRSLQAVRNAYYEAVKDVPQLMVMEEMSRPKKTFLLKRGRYDMPGEPVIPATPPSILAFPANMPPSRLGLAQWLTSPDHPLTARVAVNRLWQQFFGTGLVKTSEDFGNQGEMPSHPELLDWLAVSLRESGWDLKRMIKLIVTSATYRQDSYSSPALREMDPENRLLARGPSMRLTAEMMRDNALAASGLLNPKIGGPSVYPYQPAGLWAINSMNYKADSTDAMYRRSVYVVVKRAVPLPTLSSFDASERTACLSRRSRTNTPLQALVTLNDPAYVEAAKALGASVAGPYAAGDMIVRMYRSLTGRSPTDKELALLTDFHEKQLKAFAGAPEKMKGWLDAGIYQVAPQLDRQQVSANAVVASLIMNSDATITKR